ncbi:PadR family transcriptional regulator [Nocardia sp. alder85J]|nr:PadR family transcriptional regulator [Nocardia sp. alder85J]MCX4095990.1 PadR family transcriptional regulator [Nocardia sp. alder85J]
MSKQPGATLTPLALSVLALLEERPMHPYEMYQLLLSRREEYLVKIRPGSLYHTVDRLAEQELVRAEGTDRAGNRPERTTYRITASGTAALRARLTEILRKPIREFPIFPLALSEAHNLPKEEVIDLLTERIRWLELDVTEFDALQEWASARRVPRRYWMVLEFLRVQAHTEATWLRQLVAELTDGRLTWHRFAPDGKILPDLSDDEGIGHDWGTEVTDDVLASLKKGGAGTADQ